ncbi:MAG: L,D-transpeptidase family protein, partial [Deltaproteobacteria bacterium]|nr:L,D-transpeptidase family protein [Deltaproteobacteria bacterium]
FLFTFLIILASCVAKKQDLEELKPDQSGASVYAVSNDLKNQILNSKRPIILMVGQSRIQLSDQVSKFYELQNYQPIWSNNSEVLPQANTLISIIKDAENEGLQPSDYHLEQINISFNEIQNNKDPFDRHMLAKFDLLLTDSLILYVSHLINGRTEPQGVDLTWLKTHNKVDFGKMLSLSLDSNQFQNAVSNYQNPLYKRLRKTLIKYKLIQANGGWPFIPPGSKIERGQSGERIKLLRKRLIISGDQDEESSGKGDTYDEILENAILKFQRRHGLTEDGIVGPSTLAALNVPVDKRINQIKINMERYRWLPQNIGSRYIEVNIPSFHLNVIQNGKTVLSMAVVVGKPYWNTPLFSANMTYLDLNPYWNIPKSIAVEETLPKIREDAEYLSRQNIEVFQGWTNDSNEIDPSTIDWSRVSNHNLRYRFRQNPGPSNPLGRIKFMLPNSYNVYLHDTPKKSLFRKSKRDFSHGCIRVENPIGLAEYVLSADPGWAREKIESEIRKGRPQSILLPEPMPVYLVYFTSWVDDEGNIQFRDDIYGKDEALYRALLKTS